MEIKNDKSYLYLNERMYLNGFADETVLKLRFQGYAYDSNSKPAIQTIKDYLEENYKMYQYKKDNGVKYGEHELFYWSNGESLYFTIDFNDKNSNEYNENLVNEIVSYIENNFENVAGDVSLQYTYENNWNRINEYVSNEKFDIENLCYEKVILITSNMYYVGNSITLENRDKLLNLEKELLSSLKNKKVIYNGIKGTLKEIKENVYGVFKPRATKTYYPIELSKIKSLEIV